MPKRYPPEFRHRVLELVKAGRSVSEVASELEVSSQAIYDWRRQAEIGAGLRPGVRSTENAALVAARRRIAELEAELAVTRRVNELLRSAVPPKGASSRSQ